ncbi:unnamed protein product [Thlaspi arvense]|uniref:Uncharacterized protein n=1 Tax=Thlaspi arvense TaxID=13288 RepID=A0AAU9SMA7_THLAR|nr:unnamed protein product [Thlaspi arvense]
MGTESKGRAWFGKIFNKLETILVEVDTFTSQNTLCLKSSDPSGWESVRGEPDEVAEEDRSSVTCDLQKEHDPPSHQNFEILGNVRVEEDCLKESLSDSSSLDDGELLSGAPLLQEYCDGSLTSGTTLGVDEESVVISGEKSQITNTLTPQKVYAGETEEMVEEGRTESCIDVSEESQSTQSSVESFEAVVDYKDDTIVAAFRTFTDDQNLNQIDTKIQDAPVQDHVANMRSSNEDDVVSGKSDVGPLDTKALYGMTYREDPSYDVDDSSLYAVRVRTKKLRSFKRKVMDALTTKRRREKEYEQLAIWFGDAAMGSDLAYGEDSTKHMKAIESEDSQWELL